MGKSDATKAQMMRAAILLFTSRGYEGASVREIAAAAGVNIGLIRYHFGHKADLYRDTLAHVSEPYNAACLAAFNRVRRAASHGAGSAEDLLYAWLAAPFTDWPSDAVASGEEVLCFLNRMGYETPELTREVYESHFSYALSEWQEALRAHFPQLSTQEWMWCLTCLRGMYFNVVAHHSFTLWGLPPIHNRLSALRQLACLFPALVGATGA